MLVSTLKQSSLCLGEESATFTCTATGAELTWIAGGTTLSFNINAMEGTTRLNQEGYITATLLHIDREDNGVARRLSVLTVRAQPQATDMLSVKCHNGSNHLAEEIAFLPRPAGTIIHYRCTWL